MWGYDMRRGMNVSWESYDHYTTDLITDESIELIKSHDSDNPLFLYVAHLAVHSANSYRFLEAPADIIKKFDYIKDKNRKIFAAMLWKMDESIGKIVDVLDQKGMLNNTIIIFTSDNGGPAAGFNNNAASNWPLRGVKDTLWEGGVRGNAFIWSRKIPVSKVNNELMHILDWLPTILAAVNSSSLEKEKPNFDGHNMWPVLTGEKYNEYNEILLNIDQLRNISALRKGEWKIISGEIYDGRWDKWYGPSGRNTGYLYNITDIENSLVAIALKRNHIEFPSSQNIYEIRKNISVICRAESQVKSCNLKNDICLFNVVKDPCEMVNEAENKKQILKDLIKSLRNYVPVTPLNKPIDPRSNPKYWNYTWTNWMDYV